jgi:hypothetical protein
MTREQYDTVAARAYNDCAREMQREGVVLTHAQADRLGIEALDWLRTRLGLRVEETAEGVECSPASGV